MPSSRRQLHFDIAGRCVIGYFSHEKMTIIGLHRAALRLGNDAWLIDFGVSSYRDATAHCRRHDKYFSRLRISRFRRLSLMRIQPRRDYIALRPRDFAQHYR